MRFFAFLSILLPMSAQAAVEKTTIRTMYGGELSVQVNVPANAPGLAPAVVLAPGQGYHMDLPLLAELADALEAKGTIVYRFNWEYFGKPNGEPSPDGKKEAIDMQAVVAHAKHDPRVDSSRLSIAGKSLGSRIGYYVFTHDDSLRALALLTPLCTTSYDDDDKPLPAPIPGGERNYPLLGEEKRPVLFATSDADPACQLPMLADFLKPHGGRFPFTVVGGDHGWNVSRGTDDASREKNRANRATGIGFVTGWLEQLR